MNPVTRPKTIQVMNAMPEFARRSERKRPQVVISMIDMLFLLLQAALSHFGTARRGLSKMCWQVRTWFLGRMTMTRVQPEQRVVCVLTHKAETGRPGNVVRSIICFVFYVC